MEVARPILSSLVRQLTAWSKVGEDKRQPIFRANYLPWSVESLSSMTSGWSPLSIQRSINVGMSTRLGYFFEVLRDFISRMHPKCMEVGYVLVSHTLRVLRWCFHSSWLIQFLVIMRQQKFRASTNREIIFPHHKMIMAFLMSNCYLVISYNPLLPLIPIWKSHNCNIFRPVEVSCSCCCVIAVSNSAA